MSVLWLVTSFLKIGVFGFGGGLAILPLIFQEVAKYGNMSASEFANLVAISQVTPGPMAINAATFVGFDAAGVLGAAVATVSVALPGFILVIIAVYFLERFKESTVMKGILTGIRPATVGLIFTAVIYVAAGTVFREFDISTFLDDPAGFFNYFAVFVFAATVFAGYRFKINPILLIVIMGTIGAVTYGYIL